MKKLILAVLMVVLLVGCGKAETKEEVKTDIEVVEEVETIEEISDEEYKFYNDVFDKMTELDPDMEKEENEVLEEIGKEYGMTGEEVSQKLFELMTPALERSKREQEAKTSNVDEYVEKYASDVRVTALAWIKEIEQQAIAGFAPSASFNVRKYSYDPVFDQAGNEYPYSFIVNGDYEEKGTGKLRKFSMIVGYMLEEEIESGSSYLLQYSNNSGNSVDVIAE